MSVTSPLCCACNLVSQYTFVSCKVSFVSPMLKNSIICMTSLMHHLHVNRLEQEFAAQINKAHHALDPLHERSEVYDKRHVWSKNHSGCLEISCHVRGPLRNKMAMLGVIPSRSDIDTSADPVPDQTICCQQ